MESRYFRNSVPCKDFIWKWNLTNQTKALVEANRLTGTKAKSSHVETTFSKWRNTCRRLDMVVAVFSCSKVTVFSKEIASRFCQWLERNYYHCTGEYFAIYLKTIATMSSLRHVLRHIEFYPLWLRRWPYPAWFEGRLVISYGYLSQSSIREVNIAEYFPRWGIGSGSEGSGTELINICVRARSVKGGSPQLVPIPSMFKNYQFLGTQWK